AVLGLAQAGDHIVAGDALYGATTRLLARELARCGVAATFVPADRLEAVRAAMRPNTRALLVETLANPLLSLADLSRLAEIAHAAGAAFVVDNTFATPCLVRPLARGAEVVIHSLTKFLGGHSDLTL